MMNQFHFKGFPVECVKFYDELRKNNTKAWFDEHKPDFEKYVMEPARDFVMEMGLALKKISPGIIADTRYSKSIFRPFRDTRVSKDKKPYKTHLGIFFWEGRLAKMDCPGFYFHLEPPMLLIAAGNHCFSKPILDLYRESVVDTKFGKALAKAVKNVVEGKVTDTVPASILKRHRNCWLSSLRPARASSISSMASRRF